MKEVDWALQKSTNIKITPIYRVLTYTLNVRNVSNTTAANIEVMGSITAMVPF